MATQRTVILANAKPHIRLKSGEWWVLQRRTRKTKRGPLVAFRTGRGWTVAHAWAEFCRNPFYHSIIG